MSIPLIIAAVWCFIIACVHTFVGSRTDLKPLLESEVPEPAKSTLYYCWHLVTLALFSMSGLFAWSAINPETQTPAVVSTGLSVLFAVWGFAAAAIRRQSPVTKLPQGIMFLILSALGVWGISGI